jgi:4-amino-4-deoxy-L-arabinose transferase-like glycosyltransferase
MERQQELRVALCARQMVESNDWIVPRFQENVRLRKPPMMYWLVGAVYKVTGKSASPFWTRVPGVISGLLLVALVYAMGVKLFSIRAGLWAAVTLIFSFGFVRHARLAETDITLTLFTTLAVFLIYLAFHHPRRWWLWPLAGLAMGLGFLTKGPAAVAMPLCALFLFAVGIEEGRKNFNWWGCLLLLAVTVLVGGPWYYKIYLFTQALGSEATQLNQELSDTFAKTKHPGTMAYYLYTLPRMMIPVGLLLPFAVYGFFSKKERTTQRLFVAAWFISSFLLLSLVASKQAHYAILLLPVSSLLIGRWLDNLAIEFPEKHLPVTCIALALLTGTFSFFAYPKIDGLAEAPHFLQEVKADCEQANLIHVVGINSAVFDFYLEQHVHNIEHVGQAYKRAKSGDAIVVIKKTTTFSANELPSTPPDIDRTSGKYRYLFYKKK